MSRFEVIRGVEGPCLTLDDIRIAGPKAWGGGTVIHAWDTVDDYAKVGTCNPVETATLENATAHVMECDTCGGTYEHVNGDYEWCPRCGRKAGR